MAIDGAVSRTAVEAWDKRWATSEGKFAASGPAATRSLLHCRYPAHPEPDRLVRRNIALTCHGALIDAQSL